MKNEIKKVVFTGGPCGGKSTAMAHVKRTFEDRGFHVLVVPEAATYLFGGVGLSLGDDKLDVTSFQKALIKHQVHQEKLIEEVVQEYSGKVLLLLDRGVLDSRAYASDQQLHNAFTQNGISIDQTLSGDRYDAVIHLVSAANGAEEFYTTSNNGARKETLEEARILDEKTKDAYKGFPKLQIIDNSTNFTQKIQRVEEAISSILGIPQPVEMENKYLVKVRDWEQMKALSREVDIVQYYIENPNAEERVRKRSIGNGVTYYHTIKQDIPGMVDRVETERIISPREFNSFHNRITTKIEKKRYCFFYQNQYFELDDYITVSDIFDRKNQVLELEMVNRDAEIFFPDFIEVIRDVTTDKTFRNKVLSVAV